MAIANVNGVEIYYETQGSGEPVLLVPPELVAVRNVERRCSSDRFRDAIARSSMTAAGRDEAVSPRMITPYVSSPPTASSF